MARSTTAKTEKAVNDMADNNHEELQAQVAQLKEDIAGIAATLAGIGQKKVREARATAQDAYNDAYRQGEDVFQNFKSHANDVEGQLADAVRERPLTALAIAAGAGYLLALLRR